MGHSLPQVYQLHMTLRGISPLIWRRVLVTSEQTIADLHYTLQIIMGWSDLHLNCFVIHGKEYGVAHDGGPRFTDLADAMPLADFRFRSADRFVYDYDFGDHWTHDIRVERILPYEATRTYPVCIGGRRQGPPEDCGGSQAFMHREQEYSPFHLVEQIRELVNDEEHDMNEYCAILGPYDYWIAGGRFDRRRANRRLRQYQRGDEAWMEDEA